MRDSRQLGGSSDSDSMGFKFGKINKFGLSCYQPTYERPESELEYAQERIKSPPHALQTGQDCILW